MSEVVNMMRGMEWGLGAVRLLLLAAAPLAKYLIFN